MTQGGSIRVISECFIKPKRRTGDDPRKSFYLGTFELIQMSHFYLQKGLLFRNLPPTKDNIKSEYMEKLKQSLRTNLNHFYPLAGQLEIVVEEEEQDKSFIYVDCNKGPGAKFIHACLDDVSVDALASQGHIPTTIESFFDLGQIPTNYEGDKVPMLVVQVTELVDGVFLGVSTNHALVDGTSFWHFVSSWSEIFQSNDDTIAISRPPVYERWFPEGHGPILKIPMQILPNNKKCNAQPSDNNLREVIFHLSSASIASLKETANAQCCMVNKISSFQALSAAIWRSIIRARQSHPDEDSTCAVVANARSRMVPPLSNDYLGSFLVPSFNHIKVSELLGNSLGSVALSVHQKVKEITFEHLHNFVVEWIKSPFLAPTGAPSANSVVITGSLREDAHGINFGLGEMVTVLTGSNKYDGKVVLHSEKEGRGSVSVQICLPSDALRRLEHDQEFVSLLS